MLDFAVLELRVSSSRYNYYTPALATTAHFSTSLSLSLSPSPLAPSLALSLSLPLSLFLSVVLSLYLSLSNTQTHTNAHLFRAALDSLLHSGRNGGSKGVFRSFCVLKSVCGCVEREG